MAGSDATGQREDTTRELGSVPIGRSDFRVLLSPLMRSASVSRSGDAFGVSDRSLPG